MTVSPAAKRPRKPKIRKFYIVRLNYRFSTPPGWRMENLAVLLNGQRALLAPKERGFLPFSETPRLLIDKSLGRAPVDWELFHDYWLVSDRMKRVLERLDETGVAFVKCETRCQDASAPPVYWLCDIIRLLDAVDEEKSRLKIEYDSASRKCYNLMGFVSLSFREEVVGSAHIFRLLFLSPSIICDQTFKDACREAGLRGIGFSEAADY
jgi:hypothetical protein